MTNFSGHPNIMIIRRINMLDSIITACYKCEKSSLKGIFYSQLIQS